MFEKKIPSIASVLLAIIALSSCVSVAPVISTLNAKWIGNSASAFFIEYGPPIQTFDMKEDGTLYVWQSDITNFTMPGQSTSTVSSDGFSTTSTLRTTGPTTVSLYCRIQIQTDTNGLIMSIKILRDTWGYWTTSRFYELFNE